MSLRSRSQYKAAPDHFTATLQTLRSEAPILQTQPCSLTNQLTFTCKQRRQPWNQLKKKKRQRGAVSARGTLQEKPFTRYNCSKVAQDHKVPPGQHRDRPQPRQRRQATQSTCRPCRRRQPPIHSHQHPHPHPTHIHP